MYNEYFNNMGITLDNFRKEKTNKRKLKIAILNDETLSESEKEEKLSSIGITECPYHDGEIKAYSAYKKTNELGTDTLVIGDFLWECEIEPFAETLNNAGIKEFIYADKSTALMDFIHDIPKYGYEFSYPTTYSENDWRGVPITIRGLLFRRIE